MSTMPGMDIREPAYAWGQRVIALDELRRLDPQDCVGGALLAAVLARQGREDDDDGADPAGGGDTATGMQTWGGPRHG